MALTLFRRREDPEKIQLRAELDAQRERAHQAEQAALEIMRARITEPIVGPPNPLLPPPPGINLYAFDQPIRYSTPQPPTRRPQSLITTDTMRQLAATVDLIRAAINHLKREVDAVPLKIVAKDPDDKTEPTAKRVKQAEEFFEIPGGIGGVGRRRSQFEQQWIEDLLVIGAAAFNYPLARNGKPFAILAIDAATIRPRVDAYGWPGPTDHVYEQWIYGVQVAAFTRQELRYDGIHAVSYSPYFTSAVEMLLMPATTFVAEDAWNRTWLTDGTAPSEVWELPQDWKPDQVKEYAEWFTSIMAGNTKERQQMKFVPGKVMTNANLSRKEHDFQALEEWLLHRIFSIFGVQPASVGYPGHQYKVSQDASNDQTSAFGVGQLLQFRKAQYDDLLCRLGYDELETQNVIGQEEKAAERMTRLTMGVGGPILTINEARAEEGKEPVEGGDEVLVSTQMTSLDALLKQADNQIAMEKKQLAAPDEQGGAPGQNGGSPGGGGGGSTQFQDPDQRLLRASDTEITEILAIRPGEVTERAIGGSFVTLDDDRVIFIKSKSFGFDKPSGESSKIGPGRVGSMLAAQDHAIRSNRRGREAAEAGAKSEDRVKKAVEGAKAAGLKDTHIRQAHKESTHYKDQVGAFEGLLKKAAGGGEGEKKGSEPKKLTDAERVVEGVKKLQAAGVPDAVIKANRADHAERGEGVESWETKVEELIGAQGAKQKQMLAEEKKSLASGEPFGATAKEGNVGVPAELLRAYPEVCQIMYQNLHMGDRPGPFEHKIMQSLDRVPKPILKRLKAAGVSIYAGLDDLKHLDGSEMNAVAQQKSNYPTHMGQTMGDYAAGVYSPRNSMVGVAVGAMGQSGFVAAHEIGHAMGDKLAFNERPELTEHYQRLWSGLTPYEKQDGPKSEIGKKEFLAESVGELVSYGRTKAVQRYDEQWINTLEGMIGEHSKEEPAK